MNSSNTPTPSKSPVYIDDAVISFIYSQGSVADFKKLLTHHTQLHKPRATLKRVFVGFCEKGRQDLVAHMLSPEFSYNICSSTNYDIIVEGLEACVIKEQPEMLEILLQNKRLAVGPKTLAQKNIYHSFLAWGFCFSASNNYKEVLQTLIDFDKAHQITQLAQKAYLNKAKDTTLQPLLHAQEGLFYAVKGRRYALVPLFLENYAFTAKQAIIKKTLTLLKKEKNKSTTTVLTLLEKNFLETQIQSIPLSLQEGPQATERFSKKIYKI